MGRKIDNVYSFFIVLPVTMREFSEREKEILFACYKHSKEPMESIFGTPFLAIINSYFEENHLVLRYNSAKNDIVVTSNSEVDSEKDIEAGLTYLFAISRLIKYLEEKILIDVIPDIGDSLGLNHSTTYENIKLSEVSYDMQFTLMKVQQKAVGEYLLNLIKSSYILSDEIVLYIEKDFTTKEDRKHRQQVRISVAGIVVALLIGITTAVVQVYTSFKNLKPQHDGVIHKVDTTNARSLNSIPSDSLEYQPDSLTAAE